MPIHAELKQIVADKHCPICNDTLGLEWSECSCVCDGCDEFLPECCCEDICNHCNETLLDCVCCIDEEEEPVKVSQSGGCMPEQYTAEDIQLLEALGADLHSHSVVLGGETWPFYECHCTPTEKYYCELCGVQRKDLDAPWVPILDRRLRETDMFLRGQVYDCSCGAHELLCPNCEVQRSFEEDPWTYLSRAAVEKKVARLNLDTKGEDVGKKKKWWDSGGKTDEKKDDKKPVTQFAGYGTTYQKCRHYGHELVLPDGTKIQVSSQFTRKTAEELKTAPDMGCAFYLASSWQPGDIQYSINWPDMNIPAVPMEQIKWAANEMLRLAREGKRVETGCVGGHGRTGTFLAIILLQITDFTAEQAIDWVHEKYCTEAIESEVQEWYIAAHYAVDHGLEIPEKPKQSFAYGTGSSKPDCGMGHHRKLFLAGKFGCQGETGSKKGCEWWRSDVATLEKGIHKDKGKCTLSAGEKCVRHGEAFQKAAEAAATKAAEAASTPKAKEVKQSGSSKLTSTPPQLPAGANALTGSTKAALEKLAEVAGQKMDILSEWDQVLEDGQLWRMTEWSDGIVTGVCGSDAKKNVNMTVEEWFNVYGKVETKPPAKDTKVS